MDEALSTRRPLLVVVAGRPGSGKTTLAHALARAIRCPAICRDEIKEGIVDSSAAVDPHADAVQRRANDAFFETVELLLRHGVTAEGYRPRFEAIVSFARGELDAVDRGSR